MASGILVVIGEPWVNIESWLSENWVIVCYYFIKINSIGSTREMNHVLTSVNEVSLLKAFLMGALPWTGTPCGLSDKDRWTREAEIQCPGISLFFFFPSHYIVRQGLWREVRPWFNTSALLHRERMSDREPLTSSGWDQERWRAPRLSMVL